MRLGSLIHADGDLLVCSHGRYVWPANGKDVDLFRGQMPSNVMSRFMKSQLCCEITCAEEAGFALLESLAQSPSPSRPES